MMSRRRRLGIIAPAVVALSMVAACGGNVANTSSKDKTSDYPSKDITLVIPWAAGGGTDAIGRAIAKAMSTAAGVQVIVENKEGAGSAIGSGYVQKSKPDGYTLLLNTASVITQTYMTRKDGSNTVDYTQLVPVANVNTDPYTLEVRPDAPWKSMKEFLDYARQHPGKVRVAEAGIGSQSQLLVPILEQTAGVKFNQVSFDGSGPANTALMGSHVDAHMPALGDFVSFVKDGSIKLLAISSDEREPAFPDTPTFKEQGVDLTYDLFRGIWAPKGTPSAVLDKIEKIVLDAAKSKEYVDTLKKLNYGYAAWPHDQFQKVVDDQAKLYESAMRREGPID